MGLYINSNTVSKWIRIKYGVLKGSILGPLLFIVYISDLPKAVEHKVIPILFADNICILILKCTLVQALRLCTGRTAHRGSRGIALL
jgi:hypothetical protein